MGTSTETVVVPGPINVNGNFLLKQTNYNQTTMLPTQIGYSNIWTGTNVIMGPTQNNLILPPTLPSGVWLIEGQWTATVAFSNIWFILSLSITNNSLDTSRMITNYCGGTSQKWAGHISSVFIFSTSTPIYFVGQSSSSPTSNSVTIRYTNIG